MHFLQPPQRAFEIRILVENRGHRITLVQQKVDGQEIAIAPAETSEARIVDLMEALKASVGASKAGAKKAKRKPAARAKKTTSGSRKSKQA